MIKKRFESVIDYLQKFINDVQATTEDDTNERNSNS